MADSDTALCFTSAAELAMRIRRGDLSPVDVIEAHLDRIEERDDEINAYVTVTAEDARDAAREAERAVGAGDDLGPLHGVPVAIKDLDNVAGVRTTFGSRLIEDYVADEDDVFVERLTDAGAIVIGKTNTPEYGLGTVTDNLVAGPTGTPFDPDRTSGGSSGGSGAAVADGMAPIAQGSDTGGSIRIPAAFCGIYGLKPSFGRIPRPSRPDAFSNHTPFSHLGPMTRTVEDAALMLDVMAGPHPDDPFALPTDTADYLAATRRSVADMTVAYSPDLGAYPVAPEVRDITEETADALATAGAGVDEVTPDLGHSQDEILDAFYDYTIVKWRALFRNLADTYGVDPFGADRDKLRPVVVETIFESKDVTTAEYKQADVVRTDVYDGITDVLDGGDYDLLVTPTNGIPPFPIDDPPTEIDGTEIEPLRGWLLCQPFNFSGHPVASVPGGLTEEGLPVGVQFVGERFADDDVLAASAALERVRPWEDDLPR